MREAASAGPPVTSRIDRVSGNGASIDAGPGGGASRSAIESRNTSPDTASTTTAATASCAGWMRMGRPRSRSERTVLGGGRDPLDDGVERVGRGAGGPLRQEVEGPGVESQVVHANPSFAMTGAAWASRDRRRHFVA